ncbi:MAG: hypothetical protein IKX99_05545 [Lachnospiraceae bacterium]|nr:hypothetical protein [Lachnospiraceae bacterium]MBO4462432.1 hypothetical protein [Lachnospiraceae bacterium]MBR5789548.1 hypothetical protein [Lachnospiraceae bacterium]
MQLLNKMERKFGKYAIPNLMIYFIGAYVVGILLGMVNSSALEFLTLDPYYIIYKLQLWRLISWIFVPYSLSILTLIFMPLFYWFLGRTMEQVWGTFRFNIYMLGGVLFTDIGAFILYFVLKAIIQAKTQIPIDETTISIFGAIGSPFSTYYLNLSLFLAFAMTFPEQRVYIYFVIPVKYKWMALLYAGFVVYDFIVGGWIVRAAIIISLLNFFIFFFMTRKMKIKGKPKMHKVKMANDARDVKFKTVVNNGGPNYRHKCAICGRTERDDPTLQFRFCTKCDGNHEYCQDHLFTHEHIRLN